jgi:hypothetical protein
MMWRTKEDPAVAKKPIDAEALALEALANTLVDPTPKVLLGSGATPGFFKGATAAAKAAARVCEERHWVTGTGEWVGRGASRKQKYRLTPAGLQAVLGQSEPLALLRSLGTGLQQQVEQFRSMRDHLGLLVDRLQPLTEAVGQLAKRLEPPDVEQLMRQVGAGAATTPVRPSAEPSADTEWLNEVVRLVMEQKQRDRYQPLTLPQIYAAIVQPRPGLTIGQYHDGLRALREQKRIRLSPYTRALATLDDARNALFLDGEVMYYVELP